MNAMKEFFAYFFGQGDVQEFDNFSLAHFLPILLAATVIYVIFRYRNKIADSKYDMIIRYTLAFAMIICEMSYFWRLVGVPSLGANPVDHLPITVCGWATVFGSYMLIGKSQTLFDITYFWVFAGSIFALITPTVIQFTGPTRFRYYQFWAEHLLGYVAIFFLIFVHKMRPTLKSLIKSYCALAVLAVVAFFANKMLGGKANYLFMATTEEADSIVNLLPSFFPLKILIMASVVTVLFGLAYLPWFIKDLKEKKLASANTASHEEKAEEEKEPTAV